MKMEVGKSKSSICKQEIWPGVIYIQFFKCLLPSPTLLHYWGITPFSMFLTKLNEKKNIIEKVQSLQPPSVYWTSAFLLLQSEWSLVNYVRWQQRGATEPLSCAQCIAALCRFRFSGNRVLILPELLVGCKLVHKILTEYHFVSFGIIYIFLLL